MIDLHSHFLPGLDDGATDLAEAVAICQAAAADGIEIIAATPHVRFDFPTAPAAMETALAMVRDAVGDLVRLLPGGEVHVDELDRPIEELARFGLGGNPRYLLVETPYTGWPLGMPERLFRLSAAGITPVLAHPERNAEVQAHPELLDPIIAGGSLIQLTAASIDGRLGRRAKVCADSLVAGGYAHLIASDAHSANVRAIGLSAAVGAIADDELARWLTVDVPRAIIENTDIPFRSPTATHGRLGTKLASLVRRR